MKEFVKWMLGILVIICIRSAVHSMLAPLPDIVPALMLFVLSVFSLIYSSYALWFKKPPIKIVLRNPDVWEG